jgi:hypothetical protein
MQERTVKIYKWASAYVFGGVIRYAFVVQETAQRGATRGGWNSRSLPIIEHAPLWAGMTWIDRCCFEFDNPVQLDLAACNNSVSSFHVTQDDKKVSSTPRLPTIQLQHAAHVLSGRKRRESPRVVVTVTVVARPPPCRVRLR